MSMSKLIISSILTLISIYILAFKSFWIGLFLVTMGVVAIYLNIERFKDV